MHSIPDKPRSPLMFDGIAARYDFVNTMISGGLHHRWRNQMMDAIPQGECLQALDLATGTADVALSLAKLEHVKTVIGVDLSEGMLALGQQKVHQSAHAQKITLQRADAQDLPFDANSFDVVTISFGIRNIPSPLKCLQEVYRVLRPGGVIVVLESGQPSLPFVRFFHRIYMTKLMPLIGGILSGKRGAYEYLHQTVASFPHGSTFVALLNEAGFTSATNRKMLWGSVQIYRGQK